MQHFLTYARRLNHPIVRGMSLIAALGLFYWGYCWGWWARDWLLAQYVFQCNCPAVSEQVRYAPFRVLASPCNPYRLLAIAPNRTQYITRLNIPEPVLIAQDIIAKTEHTYELPNTFSIFAAQYLTQDIVLLSTPRPYRYAILSLPTKEIKPLQTMFADTFEQLPVADQERLIGTVDTGFQSFELIFITTKAPPASSEYAGLVLLGSPSKAVYALFTNRGIPITPVPRNYVAPRSENSQWEATGYGIVEHTTQKPIVPIWHNTLFKPLTWVGQDQAVMYDPARVTYVIAGGNGPPISLNFFRVPQPILILDMPKDAVP